MTLVNLAKLHLSCSCAHLNLMFVMSKITHLIHVEDHVPPMIIHRISWTCILPCSKASSFLIHIFVVVVVTGFSCKQCQRVILFIVLSGVQ